MQHNKLKCRIAVQHSTAQYSTTPLKPWKHSNSRSQCGAIEQNTALLFSPAERMPMQHSSSNDAVGYDAAQHSTSQDLHDGQKTTWPPGPLHQPPPQAWPLGEEEALMPSRPGQLTATTLLSKHQLSQLNHLQQHQLSTSHKQQTRVHCLRAMLWCGAHSSIKR